MYASQYDATVMLKICFLSVYQLELLESQNAEDYTPSGVVLALVGTEPQTPSTKDPEVSRSIRMYNLASLISLARWAVTQPVCHYSNKKVHLSF